MKRHQVMIVDDTPANAALLTAILREQYHIVTAASGQEALDLIEISKPDLILLDVMMPGLDGYQLCTILKGDPATRGIPVIFVTAMTHEREEVTGLELGAIDYITKPIRPQIVRARVRNHLELKCYRDLLETLSTAADRAKKEFLRSISHELRTPLTPIIGMTDLVLNKEEDDQKRKYLYQVQKAALKLLTLIEDLIETSRLTNDAVELRVTAFALTPFLDAIVAEVDALARMKQLLLRVTVDPALPETVAADAALLQKVLGVLLGNAVKFTPEGEVAIEARRVARDGGDGIRFSVSDTGVGISEADLKKIFNDFTQSDGSITRSYPGLGLGLTLARRISELMEGSIWAESRTPQGSTFHLEIPLLQPSSHPEQ